MCLSVTVEISDLDPQQLRGLARAISGADLEFVAQGPSLLRRHTRRLALHGCDLLADEADWNASTWTMTDEGAQHLASSFDRLFELVTGEVNVAAIWDGDQADTEQAIGRNEFLRLITASGLGTKTRYVIAS